MTVDINNGFESKYVTACVTPEDLFKEDKSSLFVIKDCDDSCSRWWRKGETARPKVIALLDMKS